MYKQRHKNSNFKKSAGVNYAHIQYIATRPRVMKNEGMSHGLFGRLDVGEITHFEDYKDIAKLIYANTKKGITMYRGIISVSDETAKEIMLNNQTDWKRYIENHISTIAEKNHIKRENLAFVCAVHKEKSHPHIHLAFWDKSQENSIKNPFVPPKIPNDIRRQLIKDTFKNKILEFSKQKDEAVTSMRQVTKEMVDDFDKALRSMSHKKYKTMRDRFNDEKELEHDLYFSDEFLNTLADKVFKIKGNLPPKGRISYQLLPPEVKTEVDDLVAYVLEQQPEIKTFKEEYVNSKMQMVHLYGGTDDYLKKQADKYGKEADKIIANGILGMVKSINRLDIEGKTEDYLRGRRQFFMSQMMYEISDMLKNSTHHNNISFDEFMEQSSELSAEAKKELFLKYQDKGYEH